MTQPGNPDRYKHAKSSWMSARESFALADYLAGVGEAEGSIDPVMREGKFRQYYQEVQAPPEGQSDFRSCVPLVYSILNGIELFIKACEYAAYPWRAPKVRAFPSLLQAYAEGPYPKEQAFGHLIETYTGDGGPDLLRKFLAGSGQTLRDLLTVRRHISYDGFFTALERYNPLFYTRAEGREFFRTVKSDVTPVILSAQALAKDIDDDGNPGALVKAFYKQAEKSDE
ncbi:MAG: hypothetical protein LBQ16_07490 [Gracilibacteraceae bacterium]|jgi:hypothetical protein|nr:hypothetical protein [Gracilibacteraceae bacterium]